ncbi:MAG TPA: hypothetical protein VEU96_31705 [Bryobacteraceae bacterium]|nr:hypothetical protein [Bryobacteraceae bacterium]
MKNAIRALVAFALILASAQAQKKSGAAEMALLLEKSGYTYTKISDGVWEITFKGKNTGEFPVRLAIGGDVLVTLAKLADRKDLNLQPAFLTQLLELNDSLDSIKIALSDEMLYVRMDTHLRLIDSTELKYLLEQISGATDEMYPKIKQYLPK